MENNNHQKGSTLGWAILGFFIPVVGLVLWLVWRDKPDDSRKGVSAGKGALVNVFLNIILVVIWFVFLAITANNMSNQINNESQTTLVYESSSEDEYSYSSNSSSSSEPINYGDIPNTAAVLRSNRAGISVPVILEHLGITNQEELDEADLSYVWGPDTGVGGVYYYPVGVVDITGGIKYVDDSGTRICLFQVTQATIDRLKEETTGHWDPLVIKQSGVQVGQVNAVTENASPGDWIMVTRPDMPNYYEGDLTVSPLTNVEQLPALS